MSTVPLRFEARYYWTCTECGTEQYSPGTPIEITAADRADPALRDARTGDFFNSPDEVECDACGGVFPSHDLRD